MYVHTSLGYNLYACEYEFQDGITFRFYTPGRVSPLILYPLRLPFLLSVPDPLLVTVTVMKLHRKGQKYIHTVLVCLCREADNFHRLCRRGPDLARNMKHFKAFWGRSNGVMWGQTNKHISKVSSHDILSYCGRRMALKSCRGVCPAYLRGSWEL